MFIVIFLMLFVYSLIFDLGQVNGELGMFFSSR